MELTDLIIERAMQKVAASPHLLPKAVKFARASIKNRALRDGKYALGLNPYHKLAERARDLSSRISNKSHINSYFTDLGMAPKYKVSNKVSADKLDKLQRHFFEKGQILDQAIKDLGASADAVVHNSAGGGVRKDLIKHLNSEAFRSRLTTKMKELADAYF